MDQVSNSEKIIFTFCGHVNVDVFTEAGNQLSFSLFKTSFGYFAFRLYTHWDSTSTVHLLLLYWLCQNLCLCGSQQTGKFFKRWEYQTTLPASWEICMQVRQQQLELDMEQRIGSK